MARRFVRTSSQQLNLGSSPVSGPPLTLAIRAKATSFTANPYYFTLAEAAASRWFSISVGLSGSNGLIRAIQSDNTTTAIAEHGTAAATGNWLHCVAVFAGTGSRSINYNNLTKVTETTVVGSITPGLLTIGAYRDGSFGSSNWADGDLAEAAVWDVALTDDEQAAYMRGVSPLLIRPQSLLGYWPLIDGSAPDLDRWRNRYDLTPVNTPTMGEHPPGLYSPAGSAPVPAGSTASLSADPGSYAITGSAATFRRATKVAAEYGIYAITGAATTLEAGLKLVIDAGSYAITGAAATLLRGKTVAADAGTYTITGAAAALKSARTLVASFGSYVISGAAASLFRTKPSTIIVFAGGTNITDGVDLATLKKEETNDAITSNTCTFEYKADTPPSELQEITVRRGIGTIEFAGTVLGVKQFYYGIRHNLGWRISCQDFTWLFNSTRHSQKWSGAVSATTIAQEIVALGAGGFTSTNVEASLATVTDFEIINKTRGEALKLLGEQVGATVIKIGYDLDVHFRVTPSVASLPTDITDLTKSGDELLRHSESGQIRTRQRGLGVRVRIPSLIPAGSTTVAVDSVDKLPSSGQLQVGSKILSFTAQSQTQTPSGIAGVAAAPTVALASSPAGGVLGAVRYCVTFETPDGETPPGAQSSQVTGATIAAPAAGTAAQAHLSSIGLNTPPGDYYAAGISISRSGSQMSFTLGSGAVVGERVYIFGTTTGVFDGVWTVAAVSSGVVTINGVSTAAPLSDSGYCQRITGGPLVGVYNYKLAWISALGIGALSTAFSTTAATLTTLASATPTQTTGGALTTSGSYYYYMTAYTESGDTAPFNLTSITLSGANNAVSLLISQLTNSNNWHDLRVRGARLYRGRAGEQLPRLVADFSRATLRALNAFGANWVYLDTTADTALGGLPATGDIGAAIGLTGLPAWPDARITGLAVLRTTSGGATYFLHSIISSSSTTTFLDTMSDAELVQQQPVPATTFGGHTVSLSNIATLAGATARNIYRLFNGVWRYCGTIPNNTDTTFTDSKADAELGAPIKIAGYLTGISALASDIVAGETGRLHVVRNDAAAQATVAAAMGRGDGIFEGPVLDDETLGQTALEAACDAELDTFSAAIRTVTFRSRDVNLQPGKTITFNLGGTTNIVGTFTIQRVVTSEMDIADGLFPLRTVTAGPVLATLRKTIAA